MHQISLFDAPDRSKNRGYQDVLRYLRSSGGDTREGIATALHMKEGTVCARIGELKADGLVYDSDPEKINAFSGKSATVLKARC